VAGSIASPLGSPLADQPYGAVPPLDAIVVLGYAALTVQFGTVAVVIDGATLILNEKLAVVETLKLSFAVTTAVKLPLAVGVPLTAPLDASIVMPAGKPVADHVMGAVPLLLVIVVEG
jgi:hypothetical protein